MERIANATLRIQCGSSSGSGFHFINEQTIVTNYHVVEPYFDSGQPIVGITEHGERINLQLLAFSDKNTYDFVILRATSAIPDGRVTLKPKVQDYVNRGTEICFSGFPHGIEDLLVHKAYISGPANQVGFYIDGSVNGGNSGGPIIDISDLSVIGIVTQRRFLGAAQLQGISSKAKQLQSQCNQLGGGGGRVVIMGIDFTQFAGLMGESFSFTSAIIEANANSGIGIGFHIKYVTEKCHSIGIV